MTLSASVVTSVSVLLALWGLTQTLAMQAHYYPVLGAPWLTGQAFWVRHGLYAPWAGLSWLWQFGVPSWTVLGPALGVAAGLGILPVLLRGVRQAARDHHGPPALTGHGETQWATDADVRRAGLRVQTGIVLGTFGGKPCRFGGEENVLWIGPQRSGKGTTGVIPTLLEVPGHTICVDVRGETYAATAGYRAEQLLCQVHRFAITQPGSARFNLLDEIRVGTAHEFFDAAVLADMLVDPSGGKLMDRDHWEKTSKALITCAILYEVHQRTHPTLSQIASFWSQPGKSMEAIVQDIVTTAPTQQVAELGQEILNKAKNESSGVVSSMMTQLFVFRDPTIAANTHVSDFRLADFTQSAPWQALYLVLSPGEEEHVRPFLRCFLRLALGRWLELGETKHQITLILDEFTSYGRMPFLVNNLAYMGGRGIRSVLLTQNVPQLDATYDTADLIIEQCKVQVYFAANGQRTGATIARQMGTGTAHEVEESWTGMRWWAGGGLRYSTRQHPRALVTDTEAQQLPADVALIKVTGFPPIWGQKRPYWQDRTWAQRAQIPAP